MNNAFAIMVLIFTGAITAILGIGVGLQLLILMGIVTP